MLMAQAELRETRTRRPARKVDYVYTADVDSEASNRSVFALVGCSADMIFGP